MKIIVSEYPILEDIVHLESMASDGRRYPPAGLVCKPESALLKDGKPFFFPDFTTHIEAKFQMAARVCKVGKNIEERFAHRYYQEVGMAVNFYALDILGISSQKNSLHSVATTFDGSSVLGRLYQKEDVIDAFDECLCVVNGVEQCLWDASSALTWFNRAIAYASRFFTIKIGDIICVSHPQRKCRISIGDHIESAMGEYKSLGFDVR